MWGEIEPPVKLQRQSSDKCAKDDQGTILEDPVVVPCIPYIDYPKPPQDTQLLQDSPTDVTTDVHALLEAVVASGTQVKSQQIGDAELTPEERRKELLHQYRSKPLVFLERYHRCLKPIHLQAFVHVSTDPRAQHYSEVIQRQASGGTHKTQVRNQRYAALRALQKEGQYFSDEQMRTRQPLLYEHYIGQYLTDDEVIERSQEAMLDGAPKSTAASQGATGGLANLLLNSYQERLIQTRLQEEQDKEDGAEEEEEDDDDAEDEEDKVQEKTWEPTSEEKALLREEFISQMHQRFLDGKDTDFNYSEVDENPDYDNLDIVNRDAEEKYFDEDDEEEDEPMTE
ncbi:coiled-coil domain-containing protein 97 isoform X2 [Corythoichthys intestinalis]|uniref:coiled-coil domain-containing protein 97 isoform X2 n=1 Tax=Corythoichthys intestinalis TaxID=161448 RepID=UPI0025A5D364|nr:coiled-coil domain-containing protein 97 isoform X2 [Corythoichthys intestinalis]XP_061804891.1 coiled-coil domain-containing protein 97-like [Nerophis lumbriciformis]